MRLGAPVFDKYENGEDWALIHKKYGYRAAYSPISDKNDLHKKDGFTEAAKKYDIIIAEVGAWSNPVSPDPAERKKNLEHCKNQLFVADEMGANCCVNVAGNTGAGPWAGHSAENFTSETFDLIVETTREIIDAVSPKRTCYTLEMMPWMHPYDEESYLDLIRAIDRENFAVHIDICNIINSPLRYYNIPGIIKDCFSKLGRYIKSVHIKDVIMSQEQNAHISEIIPGKGKFCHKTLVEEVRRLDPDIPLMLEHLATKEDYIEAGDYIKGMF
jgi:sugar phosphate isomerase/epimerase